MYDKKKFIKSYIEDAEYRLEFAHKAFNNEKYNVVIRECQTSLELAIKSLLFSLGRVIPKTHNLKDELNEIKDLMSDNIKNNFLLLYRLASKLRLEREKSMYGDINLNQSPDEIFSKEKAEKYLKETKEAIEVIEKELKEFL